MAASPGPASPISSVSLTRDTVFISYAKEDLITARWLAIKLKTIGYKVWLDEFELLGGEDYVDTIDKVISTQACKVVHLLSNFSRNKRNPKLERDRAIKVAERDGLTDFLIPLNLDGQKDLNWQISDTTFISFADLYQGLNQLIAKLEQCAVPRTTSHEPFEIIRALLMPDNVTIPHPEPLFSNAFCFTRIPSRLMCWKVPFPFSDVELRHFSLYWAFHRINDTTFVSFDSPPKGSPFEFAAEQVSRHDWHQMPVLYNVRSTDIVQNLLHRSIVRKCAERGLLPSPGSRLNDSNAAIREFYFPQKTTASDTISFRFPQGERGLVHKGGAANGIVHRLAFTFSVRVDISDSYAVVFKTRVFLISANGLPVQRANIAATRKKVTAAWFNRDFVRRILAIASFLGDGNGDIVVGQDDLAVVLSSTPIQSMMPFSVNDAVIDTYNKFDPKDH